MDLNALRDTWLMFQREQSCSVDRMLCDPQLRTEFLAAAEYAAQETSEFALLCAVVGLRKNKKLPAVERLSFPD